VHLSETGVAAHRPISQLLAISGHRKSSVAHIQRCQEFLWSGKVLVFAAEKLAMGSIKQKSLETAGDVLAPDEIFHHLSNGVSSGLVKHITS
jgi:hypothetical protein